MSRGGGHGLFRVSRHASQLKQGKTASDWGKQPVLWRCLVRRFQQFPGARCIAIFNGIIQSCIFLILPACLVSFPIESQLDEVNLPPYFAPDLVSPATEQVVEFDPEREDTIEFSTGPISDPNGSDRLYWRWFFDYRRATFNLPVEFSEARGAEPDQLEAGLRKEVTPCSEPTYSLLNDEEIHRIELVVADRPFINSTADDPRPNQMVPDDGHYFRMVWFVRFDRSKCP